MNPDLIELARDGNNKQLKLALSTTSYPKSIKEQAAYVALESGNPTVVDQLLGSGLAIDDIPLAPHKAAIHNQRKCLERLAELGADFTSKDEAESLTPAELAEKAGKAESIEFFTEYLDFCKATRAIHRGDVGALEAVVEESPDILEKRIGSVKKSLLHIATDWPGHFPKAAESIRVLTGNGIDVNARVDWHSPETPLHYAASSDDLEAAEALIESGADLNALGSVIGQGPPLYNALAFECLKVAKLLLDRGARFNIWIAAGMGDMKRVQDFFDEDGKFDLELGKIEGMVDKIVQEEQINLAFLYACWQGHLEIAKLLHGKGADVNTTGPVNTTPLDDARSGNRQAVVAWLLEHGAKTYQELNEK